MYLESKSQTCGGSRKSKWLGASAVKSMQPDGVVRSSFLLAVKAAEITADGNYTTISGTSPAA